MPYAIFPERSLSPVSGEALRLTAVPSPMRTLALWLVLLLILGGAALVAVPWQQSVNAKGKVTVFSPMERPQTLEAQIPGRLVEWKVVEGDFVARGQLLGLLEDLEGKFLDPAQPERLRAQMEALRAKQAAAVERLSVLARQEQALEAARAAAVPAAAQKVLQDEDKLAALRQALEAARQDRETARLNLARVQSLHDSGLRSTRDLELAGMTDARAAADLEKAERELQIARRSISISSLEQAKIEAEIEEKVQKVQESVTRTHEAIADIDNSLQKLAVELGNLEVRRGLRSIYAPSSGRLVRLARVGAGETVKVGDVLATIAPETKDQAVELFVSGFDAPLVSEGRPVRLMFDGFPAVPFVAWPWSSVGTFGGTVAVVDAVDDGEGSFRVLVRPDEDWPPPDRLRPGTGVHGFIMLDEVPLYFELWRRLNAFPPVPMDMVEQTKAKPVLKR